MSNKSPSRKGVEPKLRFPKFRNTEEWQVKEVGEIFKVTRGEVLSMTLVSDKYTTKTPYPVYSSQTKNRGLSGYYSDYLYEDAITWTTDGANAGDVNFRSGKFYCTNVCGVLLSPDGYANSCVAALLNGVSRKYVSYVGNPKLMNGVMSKIPLPIPSSKEQQKIADFLSSLDELIEREDQKLDALQQHKKGLMQEIFPVEGETLPKRRFPEFQSAPEWETQALGVIARFVNDRIGLDQLSKDNYISTENILADFAGITFASKLPSTGSATRYNANDVLVSNIRPYLKKVWVADKSGGASNDVIVIRNKDSVIEKFLAFMLQNDAFIDYVMKGAKGVKMPRGDINLMKQYPIKYPSDKTEQQKIADILSSIEQLITGQNKKLAALRDHKKGLIQQIFPTLSNESEG